jgi:hypothetical protein
MWLIVPGFRRNYPKHSIVVMLREDIQQKTLQEMLIAAKRDKDDYASVQSVAREAVGLLESFVLSSDTRGASAFPSQAETTLTRYSSTGGTWGEKTPNQLLQLWWAAPLVGIHRGQTCSEMP